MSAPHQAPRICATHPAFETDRPNPRPLHPQRCARRARTRINGDRCWPLGTSHSPPVVCYYPGQRSRGATTLQRFPAALISSSPSLWNALLHAPISGAAAGCRVGSSSAPACIKSDCPLERACVLGRSVGDTAQWFISRRRGCSLLREAAHIANPDSAFGSHVRRLVSCAIRGMGRRQQNSEESAASTSQQVVTPSEIFKRQRASPPRSFQC